MLKHKMKQVLQWAQEGKADYCDVRVVEIKTSFLSHHNQHLESDEQRTTFGLAVRLMKKGSWGFACTPDLSLESLRHTTHEALELATAGATANIQSHRLSPKPIVQDRWNYPQQIPLTPTRLQEIRGLLSECSGTMRATSPAIKSALALFRHKNTDWHYMDSEGSELSQTWSRCGAGVAATAVNQGDVQKRNYNINYNQAGGLENIHPHILLRACRQVSEEAISLTTAAEVTPKKTDLIIGVHQLALQIHESVGHPNELDRVLGWEANFAGTSFNLLHNRNKLQYGSPIVNFVVDGLQAGGTGTRAYDDEGVPAQRYYVVKEGLFQNYYTSRDTSHYLGENETSRGCVRADSWSSVPIIRIPNVSLLPGEKKLSLEELIESTEDGIFVDVNRSWSIDQRRDQFQFGVELAYEIKNGKRERLLKNVVYRGNTIPFWNSCDAICSADEFRVNGEIYCGKGQPSQVMEMAHGCSPARFRGVEVRPS